MLTRGLLLARTARHLRPSQAGHRARLRAQRAAVDRWPRAAARLLTDPLPPSSGWPEGFVPLDGRLPDVWPTLGEVAAGEVTLLGQTRRLGQPLDWSQPGAPRLWRFHLHYWDWLWGLTQDSDPGAARQVFEQVWRSYPTAQTLSGGDSWSPYVASLRAWSLCGLHRPLAEGTPLDEEVRTSLALHAGFLRRHLERDVGGNHLVKNLKAVAGLGLFLGDEGLLGTALTALRREIQVQVLLDGGHYERAPAYHCQVLADLVDVADLLAAARRPRLAWLDAAVSAMRRWLGLVLLPDGSVPLLNDGFPVPAGLLPLLEPGSAAPQGLTLLADTGLAVVRCGDLHLLADVGLPCPRELPAHAHADTLGFLLHVGAERVVSEVGTSTYEPGPLRDFERGTAAHSTVQVDGTDSTEVWGAFRAARRARPTLLSAEARGGDVVLRASHDGYTRLPGRVVHTRTWRLSERGLRLRDELTGGGVHDVVTRLHLAPGSDANRPGGLVVRSSVPLEVETAETAVGWGRRRSTRVLTGAVRVALPWRCELDLTREDVG